MFNISTKNGIIELVRGDTFTLPLFINYGTNLNPIRYNLTYDTTIPQEDIVYFALMQPNENFENAILKKRYDYTYYNKKDSSGAYVNRNEFGDMYIRLKACDTENLRPGKYFYTIKLVNMYDIDNYDVSTVVPDTEFYIMS